MVAWQDNGASCPANVLAGSVSFPPRIPSACVKELGTDVEGRSELCAKAVDLHDVMRRDEERLVVLR
jgi:hypothetical protein